MPHRVVFQHYPQALPVNQVFEQVLAVLRLEGYPYERILHAQSVCADDINATKAPEVTQLIHGPFNLGGLDGIPFTGHAGMGAFAGHIPEDGVPLIFFGPHIGVDKAGHWGRVQRPGHHHTTASCGAASAALKKLATGDEHFENDDHQLRCIYDLLSQERERLLAAKDPIYEATEHLYQYISRIIHRLVQHTQWPAQQITLLGGVVINTDQDLSDFIDLREAVLLSAQDFSVQKHFQVSKKAAS